VNETVRGEKIMYALSAFFSHPIASTFIGASITWWVSRHYYKKAGDDLRVEAEELKKLNEMVLRALEEANVVTIRRDENGRFIGFIFKISMTESANLGDSFLTEMRHNQSDKGIENP
jgi:hypothetical protein